MTKSSFFHEEEAHCIVGELGSFLSDSRKRLRAAHEKTLPRRLSHGGCLAYRCLSRAAYLAQRAVLQLCVQLQRSALAHRGQPVVDHGFPGLLAGEVNQNPLLQAA